MPTPVYVEIYNVKNTSFEIMWELIDTNMVTGFKIFESTTGKSYEVGSNKRLIFYYIKNLVKNIFKTLVIEVIFYKIT